MVVSNSHPNRPVVNGLELTPVVSGLELVVVIDGALDGDRIEEDVGREAKEEGGGGSAERLGLELIRFWLIRFRFWLISLWFRLFWFRLFWFTSFFVLVWFCKTSYL